MTAAGGAAGWKDRRGTSRDVVAGVSVALLIIPQSMAYAELAGLPGVHGLYASAVPLLAAGLFASCPYLQTGPVALTALLTHGALVTLAPPGSPEYIRAAALLALLVGVARLIVGLAQAGKITYLMSRPVLRGFTSGAAILILLSQFPSTLGLARASESGLVGNTLAVLASPGSWSPAAAVLTTLTVAVTLLARRVHPLFPGALVAVAGGVAYSALTGYAGPVVGDVPGSLPPFSAALPWGMLPQLVVPAAVIALVGFAESTAIARSFATRERAVWSPDREFVAQGAANFASGLFAGMPVDGSFSRSSLNHLSGAGSRWSGMVTGLAVLVFLPFAGLLSLLPRAVLAGVVIAAVAGLVQPKVLASVWRLSRIQALLVWLTLALCLLLAPRIEQALLIGILLSLAIHVWRERRAALRSRVDGEVLHMEVSGTLWFASAPRLEEAISERLAAAGEAAEVVIHLDGLGRIDLTGALALKEVVDSLVRSGVPATLAGVPPQARDLIDNVFSPMPLVTGRGDDRPETARAAGTLREPSASGAGGTAEPSDRPDDP